MDYSNQMLPSAYCPYNFAFKTHNTDPMIKRLLWGLLALVVSFFVYAGYTISTTRSHSPEAVSSLVIDRDTISVAYCQPFKKGRVIFGGLVPYGEYWRTGANEPTRIHFSRDVIFGEQKVFAGTYRLYTIPGKENWKVVLNTELEKWGYYEPNYSLDVASIEVPVSYIKDEQEQFQVSLRLESDTVLMELSWDNVLVTVPFGLSLEG